MVTGIWVRPFLKYYSSRSAKNLGEQNIPLLNKKWFIYYMITINKELFL